jgi:hypothetical protein
MAAKFRRVFIAAAVPRVLWRACTSALPPPYLLEQVPGGGQPLHDTVSITGELFRRRFPHRSQGKSRLPSRGEPRVTYRGKEGWPARIAVFVSAIA